MTDTKNIALLYFSRNAAAEAGTKRWFSSPSTVRNKQLATSLIQQSSHLVKKAGLPVFHYHENNQRGNTFGERIANAYQDIFRLGYRAVIAVGNDTPQLSDINWDEVMQRLEAGHCVLGPTFRRGAYLIGLTAAAFDRKKFQHLPWQTKSLFSALVDYCTVREKSTTPHLLGCLRDVNAFNDLRKLVKLAFLNGSLKRLILALLAVEIDIYPTSAQRFSSVFVRVNALLRAPPTV